MIREVGATAVEYALMVGLVGIGVMGAASTLQDKTSKTLSAAGSQMTFLCGDVDNNGTVADAADILAAQTLNVVTPVYADSFQLRRSDVNSTGSVTAFDILRLRQVEAGTSDASTLQCRRS